jgi:hypothetical protein
MKLGIALDGLLCNKEELEREWSKRLGDTRFLEDAAFWAALTPYSDVRDAIELLKPGIDLYVMAERPKSLFLPTRAWVRKSTGLVLNKDRLIMQALKRYDCRVNGIKHFADSDPRVIENMKVEQVVPITTYHVDRAGGESLLGVVEMVNSLEDE